MNFALKNVKVADFLSEETIAFTATLWRDGVRIAYVKNNGRGGPNQIDYLDWSHHAECEAYWESIAETKDPWGYGDFFISTLLEAHEDQREQRKLRRLCKTKTVFLTTETPAGSYEFYRQPYTPEFAQSLRKQYPTLVEIINERF